MNDQGGKVYTARDLRGLESPAQLGETINEVCERLTAHNNPPVYISFDIDCLDPAFAPGTGTPEPGGLTSGQALTLIEEFVARVPNLVGMDVVDTQTHSCGYIRTHVDTHTKTCGHTDTHMWTHMHTHVQYSTYTI